MYLKWTSQRLTCFANSLSLSLSLESSFFLPSCKYDGSPFRARSCLHWLYWKNGIAPAGIERDLIPTYHETHVFAMVIRSFHCFKIGSYKFLAEGGSVYWLTAYCISIYNLQAQFILPRKQDWHSCKGDNLHEMQILFSWKNEKNISKCRLLKILASVLGVMVCTNKSRMGLCMAHTFPGWAYS